MKYLYCRILKVETMNPFDENTDIIELVHFFKLNSGFEFAEAIQYYQEKEFYNACQALEILFSIEINQFVHNC
ncbi:MAG: hypothetical protein JKY02_00700 [Flavobacteriaceae bacterium]|nr:hypothetical protein [Flavobacteriaceae bacterium]